MKIIGYILLLLLMWVGAVVSSLLFPLRIITYKWRPEQAKEYGRAIDQLCNVALFFGIGRESTSSHSWRDQIKIVIWLTELVEPGHCKEANRHEQPVVDFIKEH